MHIEFQFLGRSLCLVKQARDRRLPDAEQAARPWYIRYQRPDDGSWQWKKIGGGHEAKGDLIGRAKAFLKLLDENRSGVDRFLSAVADRQSLTTSRIVAAYQEAGCPNRGGHARTPAALAEQTKHLEGALEFFGPKSPHAIDSAACLEFAAWKRKRLTSKADGSPHAGARTCELDLSALANAFAWAVMTRRLDRNPLQSRPALRDSEAITHHHLYQPESDEELHALAAWCFRHPDPGTRVAGAQILFAAMTGLRAGELANLEWPRAGRAHNAPGMRQVCKPDGVDVEYMHVRREKRGINPVIRIHPALRELLAAWQAHCATTHRGCPWMFPSATGGPALTDFTRTLNAAASALGSPRNRFGETRRTAHALRGYYVSVRRDAGIMDSMIAAELGQGGGDRLIRSVYGAPDAFASGRLDWMPEGKPAWSVLTEPLALVVPFVATA